MLSERRTRYRTQRAQSGSFKLGAFQGAQYDGAGTFIKWLSPEPAITEVSGTLYDHAQITVDQLNGGPVRLRTGGPFLTLRYDNGYRSFGPVGSGVYTNRSTSGGILQGKTTQRYIGGFAAPADVFFGTGFSLNNPSPLLVKTGPAYPSTTGLGNRAWSGSKPKLEKMSLFQDVFESDEIPGQFSGTRDFARTARETAADWRDKYVNHVGMHVRGHDKLTAKISQEFLNANFGWLPFLRSVYDLSRIIGTFRNFVTKFTKLNGTSFRRRVSLNNDEPMSQTLSETKLAPNGISYALPVFPQSFPASYFVRPPSYTLVEETRHREWGVGKWTFYRPEFDANQPGYYSEWNKVRQALTIAGLRITPSALYNVIPWTWLLDWVTNVGDYVDELTDVWFDQIVNHYCFAMSARETSRHFIVTLPFHDTTLNLAYTRVRSSKQRLVASSPFGFDLDVSQLTGRQLGILAALSSSRRK